MGRKRKPLAIVPPPVPEYHPVVIKTDAERIIEAAQDLFDNRLGWSDGRNPYAPREIWADLGAALYGESDPRVVELRGSD